MSDERKLTLSTPSAREILLSRVIPAPRERVFAAFTQPELLQRWLTGPAGWTLAVCEIDLRVGGSYRYVWRRASDGLEMGAGGVYRVVESPERFVATELFDQTWYPGEALITVVLREQDAQADPMPSNPTPSNPTTMLSQTMHYESREARDAVLRSPIDSGMALSFDRLEALLNA